MDKNKEVNVIVDAKNKSKGAFVEIKKDLKQLGDEANKGLSKFSKSFADADKVIMSFSDKMKWMDKLAKRTFQGTAAAAGIYIGATLRDFSQLNDGISRVNTLYDQTRDSQRKMYQDSIKMFSLLPTDFNKITQGIYDTISAGADPKYATMFARKFGMAGVAGDADMDVVTKAAMGTMNAYKLEAKDLNRILDLQFMTVKDGITNYSELASSLGTGVLANAYTAGATLEELYGSIAMITKNAIPANIATTSLNQMFNKFTDTKVIKEFKKFGVQIQDSKKNTRPLIEILKDLNYQFDKRKMTSEQRKGFFKELLGSDEAARAILPLISDLKEFQKILGDMDNSSGAMDDAFNDRLESIKTQIQLMWNGLKSTGIEQIEKMNPLIEAVTGPWVKKNKIELEIAKMKDSLEFEKDPNRKKLIKLEIEGLEKELSSIDLIPVKEFREALAESVGELNKFSPAIGGFVDKLGTFVIDHLGEEGTEKREKSWNLIKFIGGAWVTSKGMRMFKDITGKTPWELGKWFIPKVFNFGKDALETLYLKSLYAKDALTKTKNANVGIYIPEEYYVGKEKYKEFENRFKDTIENKETNNGNSNNINLYSLRDDNGFNLSHLYPISERNKEQIKEVVKLMDTNILEEFLKINKLQDKMNNINMQNQIKIEPPQVNVSTRVYIDGKNIPPKKIEVDYGKVEKHSVVQARRYGRPENTSY